jgi:hypothetical protein
MSFLFFSIHFFVHNSILPVSKLRVTGGGGGQSDGFWFCLFLFNETLNGIYFDGQSPALRRTAALVGSANTIQAQQRHKPLLPPALRWQKTWDECVYTDVMELSTAKLKIKLTDLLQQ